MIGKLHLSNLYQHQLLPVIVSLSQRQDALDQVRAILLLEVCYFNSISRDPKHSMQP
jgi:hypothetical protein